MKKAGIQMKHQESIMAGEEIRKKEEAEDREKRKEVRGNGKY